MSLVKSLHKWLSVLIGLQLLIWLGTGLFFNLMDHNKSRGNEYRVKSAGYSVIEHDRLLTLNTILKQSELKQPVNTIKLIELLGKPYYLLNHYQGLYQHFYNEHSLVNAYTGEQVIINDEMAQALAHNSYSGNGEIRSTQKVSPPIGDFLKEKNTVWQVDFDDKLNTSVYVDANSGRLVGHSNDDKRFADFFFMLHFMDFGSTGGFNNWLIILFALFTLVFCLTGVIWVLELLSKGRYQRAFSKK